jgi:hypothetical protein
MITQALVILVVQKEGKVRPCVLRMQSNHRIKVAGAGRRHEALTFEHPWRWRRHKEDAVKVFEKA